MTAHNSQPGASPAAQAGMKPEIMIRPQLDEVVDEAVAALSSDPTLYTRGHSLVRTLWERRTDPDNHVDGPSPQIAPVPIPHLLERLAAAAEWLQEGRKGPTRVAPPRNVVEAVACRGEWPGLRRLKAVVEAPVLRPDGSVLQEAGYDRSTGLLLEPNLDIQPVLSLQTQQAARAAAHVLLDVVADFPFKGDEHRSAWLASVLTPFARHAFEGPAPLFLIDANTPGTGKGLLVDVTALIISGRSMPRMTNPTDEEEARKKITTIALAGDTLALIDNIHGALGGANLDAALTGTIWTDRALGKNERVQVPLVCTWFATGNNVQIKGDLLRRVVHIRLETPEEKPEERDDFRHPNLSQFVRQERPRLVQAALTLLSAYCDAGRPSVGLKPLGSFEGWSQLVRNALVWVGLPDPIKSRVELQVAADSGLSAIGQLLRGWHELDPQGTGLTAAALLKKLDQSEPAFEEVRSALDELVPMPPGKRMSARQLGVVFRKYVKRRFDGLYLDFIRNNNGHVWLVRSEAKSSATLATSAQTTDAHVTAKTPGE